MKSLVAAVFITCLLAMPIYGWETLITKDGAQIEGDITQSEFVLDDPAGGEIIIPRAAIDQLVVEGEHVTARLKDGTEVSGDLKGHIEIEDGAIRRRYQGSNIRRIDFDNFIAPEVGENYSSCPIRLSLPASNLFSEYSGWSTSLTGTVTCDDQKIVNIAFERRGDLSTRRGATVTARFTIWAPPGPDQLSEISIGVLQDEQLLASKAKRLTLDEGEMNRVVLKFDVPGKRVDPNGPSPRFEVQLVSQDEEIEVERGGFFWWFTVPIPL